MARNTLAGKGKSKNTEKTGRNYRKEYDEYQKKRKKYRAALNKKTEMQALMVTKTRKTYLIPSQAKQSANPREKIG